jgi:hypothetical protein
MHKKSTNINDHRKSMLVNFKEKIAHLSTYLILIALFLLGLNIPKLSIAPSIIIFPIILLTIPKNYLYLSKADILINFLLLGFSTSYYIISWTNGYIELVPGIRYIISIQIFYLLGHYSFFIFKQNCNNLTPNGSSAIPIEL